ncbi:MAG TPA: hypothetical protein VFM66_11765 [Agromyces sp.]|nr:hypothetical protein [Agromyces sp.]
MAINRLLRANRKVLAVPVIDIDGVPHIVGADGTTAPMSAPTTAVLNTWVPIVTTTPPAASNGGNISCALLDDLTLGTGESETDDELTICSIGNESTPTFYSVEATLTGFRDRSKADTGVFNLFTQLMNGAGVRYVFVDAIGRASTALFEVGDHVSLYEAVTDNPVDVKEDRGNIKLQQTPTPTGNLNQNYALAA